MVDVKIKDVVKRFGDLAVVDHISLEIKDGEFFFLLGPSGCGKTTLLRMISGFCDIDSGEIRFNDKLINNIPNYKRKTSMVFQSYALWPHMSVEKNVSYGLNVQGMKKQEVAPAVKKALASVRMEKYADRMPNQLSGGQQQRVALARALALSPQVILLDEPLSNLDAKLRNEMRSEMRRLHHETKITTIYVTHDQKEALSMADRIAVINNGKVEQVGTPFEIYNDPINPFVAGFIGETNFVEGEILSRSDDEMVEVKTPIGIIKSQAFPHDIRKGEKVTCSIRPEAIHLVYEATYSTEGKNLLNMKVEDRVYLGSIDQYKLSVGNGHVLNATVVNLRGRGVDEGNVRVAINPKNVLVFKL